MDTMIEKVARALYCERIGDPDYDFEDDPRGWSRSMHIAQARAAIEAMREPTEAMENAAITYGDSPILLTYEAMIDAALEG